MKDKVIWVFSVIVGLIIAKHITYGLDTVTVHEVEVAATVMISALLTFPAKKG